ncbi:MAG: circulation family protein [Rhodocyclales bacterium]|nr:circulation family protein [Rhodocyclales bacterium]
MAWADNLLDASFRGATADVLETEETIARALSVLRYPYRDGGDVEDMGDDPMPLSIEFVFFGEDYEARLDAFKKVLAVRGAGELIHPIYGSINAQVSSRRIRHVAGEIDYCSVHVDFIEKAIDDQVFSKRLAVQQSAGVAAHGDKAQAASANQAVAQVEAIRSAKPFAALDTLRQSMSGPLKAGLDQAQGVIASGLDVFDYPRAWVSDMTAVVNGVVDIANTDKQAKARWDGMKTAFDAIGKTLSSSSLASSPINGNAAPTEAQASTSTSTHVQVALATGRTTAAAELLTDEAVSPTLSPDEIEQMVNDARVAINEAIASCRALYPLATSRPITEPLKDQAAALQEAARAVIEARPPLVVRTVTAECNLRLLAHRLYGDHTRANELLRLNPRVRLPNFLQAGDVINAYAR